MATIKFTEPFFAYKGFSKDLKCRGMQFEVGGIYEKEEKDEIRLCTQDGFHYCRQLKKVFSHYGRRNANRFCKIEILGNYREDHEKGLTTKFRIVEELGNDFFKEFDKEVVEEQLGLPLLKELQTRYPILHIGGSAGLYLHGLYLKRWVKDNKYERSDLDLVSPYYILLESFNDYKIEHSLNHASSNDFDEVFNVEHPEHGYSKIDYAIDPKQRYEVIEHKGFKYKVSLLETIVEAKIRYALSKNGIKHKEDMYELLGKTAKPVAKKIELEPEEDDY